MQAIILAGGFGTRLKHIIPDIPKPMAPLQGVPFLHYLVEYLAKHGITEIVFSTHYLSEQIENYFKNLNAPELKFSFVREVEPLGTGGAIINALKNSSAKGDVLIINGDTFLDIDYNEFLKAHIKINRSHNANLSLALSEVADTARYGRVDVDGSKITAFREKGEVGKGLINAGNYLVNADWLLTQTFPEKFSFETDFLFPQISIIQPSYYVASNYFIDIGIPEDYARAQVEIPQRINL